MEKYKLVMVFINSGGRNSTITITDAKTDITQEQATGLMDTIISSGVFVPQQLTLVSKQDCKLIATTTSDFFDVA